MNAFQKVLYMSLIAMFAMTNVGCVHIAVNNIGRKAEKTQRAYYADPDQDFINDVEKSGLANVEWVSQRAKFILAVLVSSNGPESEALLDIYNEAIESPEYTTEVDKYLAFVNSERLAKFVRPRLSAISELSELTEDQWKMLEAALRQFYRDQVIGNDNPEGFAQNQLRLIRKYL